MNADTDISNTQTANKTASTDSKLATFAPRLLTWFDQYGRHDLPWQQHKTDSPDPYKVWLSEVMLQQTQVKTVIPYFQRFIESFPTVQSLADADWDRVAEHWAGLGYYARARNLHKGAKQLQQIIEQTGEFPQTLEEWEGISGVGRSTAGAIVAMGLHGYGVICDGNVKRVLTRWAGIDGDISKSATNKVLWQLAEQLTPSSDSGHFAQAMMDMGATVCIRTKPACISKAQLCPIQSDCTAHAENKQLSYPFKAKKAPKPSKYSIALIINNAQGETLWLQRPESGIWGGLWCLPLQFMQKTVGKKVLESINHCKENDDNIYNKEYTLGEQVVDGFIQKNQLQEKHLQENQLQGTDWQTKNNANKPINPKTIKPKPKTVKPKPIKHTLSHFHWYLSSKTITLTERQRIELCQRLDNAEVTYQWLQINGLDAQSTDIQAISERLALPKAMLTLLEVLVD